MFSKSWRQNTSFSRPVFWHARLQVSLICGTQQTAQLLNLRNLLKWLIFTLFTIAWRWLFRNEKYWLIRATADRGTAGVLCLHFGIIIADTKFAYKLLFRSKRGQLWDGPFLTVTGMESVSFRKKLFSVHLFQFLILYYLFFWFSLSRALSILWSGNSKVNLRIAKFEIFCNPRQFLSLAKEIENQGRSRAEWKLGAHFGISSKWWKWVVQTTFLDLSKGYFQKYLRNNNSKNAVHTYKLNYRLKLCFLSLSRLQCNLECKETKSVMPCHTRK